MHAAGVYCLRVPFSLQWIMLSASISRYYSMCKYIEVKPGYEAKCSVIFCLLWALAALQKGKTNHVGIGHKWNRSGSFRYGYSGVTLTG
jgi:hypothetical protein